MDARGSGQQGLGVDPGRPRVGPLLRPRNAPERQLQAAHEVEGASHRGPQVAHELVVTPDQPVVPQPDGDVGRHVGLAAGVLDLPAGVLHGPRAVVALGTAYPLPGAVDRLATARDEERHGGLDVVPHVGVLTGGPGDGAVRLLHRGNADRRLSDLFRGQH